MDPEKEVKETEEDNAVTLGSYQIFEKYPAINRRDFGIIGALWVVVAIAYSVLDEWIHVAVLSVIITMISAMVGMSMYWSVHFRVTMQYSIVKDGQDSRPGHVALCIPKEHCGAPSLVPVCLEDETKQMYFKFQEAKYIFSTETGTFESVALPLNLPLRHYHSAGGLSERQLKEQRKLYGLNEFKIPLPEFWELFQEHALSPFFVFQMFCVALWCLDEYWYYSVLTLVMLVIFECTTVKRRIADLQRLRNMRMAPHKMLVHRKGSWKAVLSDQLVPGDVVSLVRHTGDHVAPCDMILVAGTVVVNEALLTGESMPQLKEALPSDVKDNFSIERYQAHMVFGGTKIMMHSPPATTTTRLRNIRPPANQGCLGYVVRTGFSSGQGKLVRTMLFSTDRVSMNNAESLLFIAILLVFALVASAYVLIEGMKDESRDKWKLLLNCIMIITSVVPPELPMELSLAVNNSLLALRRRMIFCTEPFRIPFGGGVEVCCFDKTGTLTSDDFMVEGIAGLPIPPSADDDDTDEDPAMRLSYPEDLPSDVKAILGGCHSLAVLGPEKEMVGDPLEKAAFKAINWQIRQGSMLEISEDGRKILQRVDIKHRFAFSSALKRMSCIVTTSQPADLRLVSKGAPEEMHMRFRDPPANYEQVYRHFTSMGRRVLALGWKSLHSRTGTRSDVIHKLTRSPRDEVETDLEFAGFVISSCPVKTATDEVIAELVASSHFCMMITGDNALTACNVAQQVGIMTRSFLTLHLEGDKKDQKLVWKTAEGDIRAEFDKSGLEKIAKDYDICVEGDALKCLQVDLALSEKELADVARRVKVFARASPDQKGLIVAWLKILGLTVLMCGDGTNDVGALKQAHTGVALLTPIDGKTKPQYKHKRKKKKQQSLSELLEQMNEDMRQAPVQLGDASIASPFTSKIPHVGCTLDIIRQGRCTLVTTMQMYHILALNCLVSAYSMSALYLKGVKYGDTQMFFTGIVLAGFFFCLSRAQPVHLLSAERPHNKLFTLYTLVTILGQFAIHMAVLLTAVQTADDYTAKEAAAVDEVAAVGAATVAADIVNTVQEVVQEGVEAVVDAATEVLNATSEQDDTSFKPNVLNSVVYLISSSITCVTFFCNYVGHPFMQSLSENKALHYALLAMFGLMLICAMELFEPINELMELAPFPQDPEFRLTLLGLMLGDLFGCLVYSSIVRKMFAKIPEGGERQIKVEEKEKKKKTEKKDKKDKKAKKKSKHA